MNIPFTDIQLGLHNIISCKGFEVAEKIGISFGPCAKAKLGLVILFFISAFARKWLGEEAGFEYSFFWGSLGGMGVYFLVITLIGSFNISFFIGLIAMVAFGFGHGYIFGGDE